MLLGAGLGTLPDLDVFIDFGGVVENFTYHRGFSHSLFVLAPFSVVLWLLLRRWSAPVRDKPLRWLAAISLALLTHPLLDAHTAYGTQLFWPLTVPPTSWATLFIIDPLYTLPLLVGDPGSTGLSVDWLLQGKLGYAALSRKLGGRWYLGLVGRYVDVDQQIDANLQSRSLPGKNTILSAAAGLSLTYDSRDMPGNPYRGRLFTASALFTSKALGSDDDYQGYALDYRSYHSLAKPFVLAWTAQYCSRAGDVPLWDACRLNLRGSAATDYMGLSSVVAKVEGRWRLSERWGLVAFTGAGQLTESFTGGDDYDIVTNYGAGIRFTVQKSNRVNLRLDYGRVDNDAAIMLSVGEAF